MSGKGQPGTSPRSCVTSQPTVPTSSSISPPSPRLAQRTMKLNPVSAPGFKPAPPPSSLPHREEPPLAKQASTSSLLRREQQFQTPAETVRPINPKTGSGASRGREKPGKLTLQGECSPVSASVFPSPTSPLSPPAGPNTFAARRRKTEATHRQLSHGLDLSQASDKQYPITREDNAFEFRGEESGIEYGSRSSSKGARIQVPSTRDSRSPSPMSRRRKMTGNTLSPVRATSISPGMASSSTSSGSFTSCQEERRNTNVRSPSTSPSAASSGSLTAPLIPAQPQQKNFAPLTQATEAKAVDRSATYRSSRSKAASTTATAITVGGATNSKKTSNKIDINYCPASPLSPRKRQTVGGKNANVDEPFQDNYRFFLGGGTSEETGGIDDKKNNNERARRIFSPAPVRDIFSPMPSASTTESSYTDLLDSCAEISISPAGTKESKRGSASGLVFPAILVENVDDKQDRKDELSERNPGNENFGDNNRVIGPGRRSRSITSSSGSSSSTSPSPTSPPPTIEFSRHKPTRAKSTNTLLSPEASKVIDSWLGPTLSPTPPPGGSSPSTTRPHPDDARLNWRKCGSSSTSCLLSVPSPLIKRKTSEGRMIVGVTDALTVPGEGGAGGRKGMKSRGWSRSESNLFVRTGRPVGGPPDDDIMTEEDLDHNLSRPVRSTKVGLFARNAAGNSALMDSTALPLQPAKQTKEPRSPFATPTGVTLEEDDNNLPTLTSRSVSRPRPSYHGNQGGGL